MGMEQEALVKVVGMLALGSELRLPLTCADCLVKVGLPGDTQNQQRFWGREKASALQGGPRLPAGTHQHYQWQPEVQTNWPPIDMTSISPSSWPDPGEDAAAWCLQTASGGDLREPVSTLKIQRHLTSYPILCPCMF